MSATSLAPPLVLVIMGASGCGKSTLGRAIASQLGLPFLEGDDFHPAGNVAKMRAGTALDDVDRWPWLDRLAQAVRSEALSHRVAVASCSALKRNYRDRLRNGTGLRLLFVYLQASQEELLKRMTGRDGHYMPASLLASQLSTLQPPAVDEWALTLDATESLPELVDKVVQALGSRQTTAPVVGRG